MVFCNKKAESPSLNHSGRKIPQNNAIFKILPVVASFCTDVVSYRTLL